MTDTDKHHRPIRSFVRREGRLTRGQQRALDELIPRFGVEPGDAPLEFARVFGRDAPVVLDIGFGDGEALARMAAEHPERNYLGVEVHRPGVGHLLLDVEQRALTNVRVIIADASEVLRNNIPDASLAGINLFFPDPWPKKRHHKRRLVQPAWLELVAARLRPGGFLHMATDWTDYAGHMMAVVNESPDFENPNGSGRFAPNPGERPRTKFEQRGLRKGHEVRDLVVHRRQ